MEVYIVTDSDLGWDCIMQVCLSIHTLRKYCEEILEEPKNTYIYHSIEELECELDTRSSYILHRKNAI